MPTFKISKQKNGMFTEAQLQMALKNTIEHNMSIRRASKEFGVPTSTLSRYVKYGKKHGTEFTTKLSMVTKQVFSTEQENALRDYIFGTSSKMFYGLSNLQVRQLAYEFAKQNSITMPANWIKQEAAGMAWLQGFRRRSGNLALQSQGATSLARSTELNHPVLDAFFSRLKEVLNGEKPVPPQNIWNMDKIRISTVMKPRELLDGIGAGGQISSAECEVSVTMCCCINAIGNTLPPAYICPRAHFNDNILKGAPTGSFGLSSYSGWLTSDLFLGVLNHFVKFMTVSPDNPGVLLMHNDISRFSNDAVDLAREKGLHFLTFPHQYSHKLQPLNVGICGPFQTAYSSVCDLWVSSNPGKTMTIGELAELSGRAYIKSFNCENIVSSFKFSGIYPFNPDVLLTNDTVIPIRPNDGALSASDFTITSASLDTSRKRGILPIRASPYPKSDTNRKQSNKKRCAPAMIIESVTENVLSHQNKAKGKHGKRDSLTSDYGLPDVQSLDTLIREVSGISDSEKMSNRPTNVNIGDFTVVKVLSSSKRFKNFVGKICLGPDGNNRYVVSFMRRSRTVKDGFQFPEAPDTASIIMDDIICILPKPSPVSSTKRLCRILKFATNVVPFGV